MYAADESGVPLSVLYPPLGLVIRTPDLILRPANEAEAASLASASVNGIHDPSFNPFSSDWSYRDPVVRAQGIFQNIIRNSYLDSWQLKFAIRKASDPDHPIGIMDVNPCEDSPNAVFTGSWILLREQGKGYGTQARAAMLKLAFEGLEMAEARTSMWERNLASLGVTKKLGYEKTGSRKKLNRGEKMKQLRFSLFREGWEVNKLAQELSSKTYWEGLDDAVSFLGIKKSEGLDNG